MAWVLVIMLFTHSAFAELMLSPLDLNVTVLFTADRTPIVTIKINVSHDYVGNLIINA